MATLVKHTLCATFSGLSKVYRACGLRVGWVSFSGEKSHARHYLDALELLASLRLCSNMTGQWAVQTALGGYQSINDLVLPGGRLVEQRDVAHEMLTAIPGISCVKPKGALYMFPRIDPKVHPIYDDEKFVLDLLLNERLLVVQGTGFNWAKPDHFRVVTLPRVADLKDAIGRIGRFLSTYRQ
jgi:alanine-synthesizing transaminase